MELNSYTSQQSSRCISGEPLPQVDVTDRVMSTIRQRTRTAGNKKPWIMIGLITAVLFACGFGYASGAWQLFHPDGTVALEFREFESGDGPWDVDTDSLRQLLNPGEAAIFYLGANRQIMLANELQYADYDAFRANLGSNSPSRELSLGFTFFSGSLAHNPDSMYVDKYEEKIGIPIAQKAEKSVKIAGLEQEISYYLIPLGEVGGYFATYQNSSGSEITLSGAFGESWRTVLTELDQLTIGKIELTAGEAFYIQEEDDQSHSVVWSEGSGEQFVYLKLKAGIDDVSRKSLIELADQIDRRGE